MREAKTNPTMHIKRIMEGIGIGQTLIWHLAVISRLIQSLASTPVSLSNSNSKVFQCVEFLDN